MLSHVTGCCQYCHSFVIHINLQRVWNRHPKTGTLLKFPIVQLFLFEFGKGVYETLTFIHLGVKYKLTYSSTIPHGSNKQTRSGTKLLWHNTANQQKKCDVDWSFNRSCCLLICCLLIVMLHLDQDYYFVKYGLGVAKLAWYDVE